jgi:hypothetical protein
MHNRIAEAELMIPESESVITWSFLSFFPKMKVGLSNHQSVCLSVYQSIRLCVPTSNLCTDW